MIQITWTQPSNINSAPVIAYKILIANSLGQYLQDLVHCDGSSSEIIQSRSCLVPMTFLRGDPFFLTYGTLVRATVSALNINGWSVDSPANTVGPTIEVEPSSMPIPTKGALTSQT
jgi:hypothetical protein